MKIHSCFAIHKYHFIDRMLSSFYSVEECVEEWKQLTCNLTTDRHVVDQDDFLMSIRTSLLLLIGKNLRLIEENLA